MANFWNFVKGIALKGETSDATDNIEGSFFHNSSSTRLKVYIQGAVRELLTNSQSQTLTNKTIDGDDNTVQDLALASLKTNLTDANKFLVRDGAGIVISNTKDVPSGVVVGTTDSQTLTNKTIDGDDNTVQDLALASLKTVLGDANKFLVRDGSGIVVSNTKNVPSGDIVGTSDSQILTNKTIDADLNTLSNIEDADIKAAAAIALNKLAATTINRALQSDGSGFISPSSVTSTELGYLSGVTSAIQTQLNAKVETASNIGSGSGNFKQKTGTDLEFKSFVAGANITITANANDLTIASTGASDGLVNAAGNVEIKLKPDVDPFVLQSPDTVKWDILVSNAGVLSAVSGSTGVVTNIKVTKPDTSQASFAITNGGVLQVVYPPAGGETLDDTFYIESPDGTAWKLTVNNSNIIVMSSDSTYANTFKVLNDKNDVLMALQETEVGVMQHLKYYTAATLPSSPTAITGTIPFSFYYNGANYLPIYYDTAWRYFADNSNV